MESKGINLDELDRVPYLFRDYLKDYIEILENFLKGKLISFILYGSVARGKWNQYSDIDILIILENDIKSLEELEAEILEKTIKFENKNELVSSSGKKLYITFQLLILREKDLKKFRTLFYDVALDGIILYDKNDTGFNFIKEIRKQIEEKKLKRIFISEDDFYWEREGIKYGDIFEL
ncbi:MAG: nucleotidyltransferase domain-containing protein [Promethearchaeota archaeon]